MILLLVFVGGRAYEDIENVYCLELANVPYYVIKKIKLTMFLASVPPLH
jgi:hypothetical protein